MNAQEDFERLKEFVERMGDANGLDDDAKNHWLSENMKALGHKAQTVWADADPVDPKAKSGVTDMFGRPSGGKATGTTGKSIQYPNG